jgi:hypothetical protein
MVGMERRQLSRQRGSPPSSPLEPQHPLLATTRGGLDQSTTTGNQHQTSYLGDGRLIGGRGVIFPGGHRPIEPPFCISLRTAS